MAGNGLLKRDSVYHLKDSFFVTFPKVQEHSNEYKCHPVLAAQYCDIIVCFRFPVRHTEIFMVCKHAPLPGLTAARRGRCHSVHVSHVPVNFVKAFARQTDVLYSELPAYELHGKVL